MKTKNRAAEIEPKLLYAKTKIMIVTVIVEVDIICPSDEQKRLPSQMLDCNVMDVIKGLP